MSPNAHCLRSVIHTSSAVILGPAVVLCSDCIPTDIKRMVSIWMQGIPVKVKMALRTDVHPSDRGLVLNEIGIS